MRLNLLDIAGEWCSIDIESLSAEILKRHKFGKKVWFKRRRNYAWHYWTVLSSQVQVLRSETYN
jgi:hypothetical protein